MTNERDNWQSSAKIANNKLKQTEQKLENLQLDFQEEKLRHQLTLSSLISINKRRQNLRNENDNLRDQLNQKDQELNLFKLWFPNQTPPSIARGWQHLDNKIQAIKKQAAKWKRSFGEAKKLYQQEQQSHLLTKQQAETERDNYQQQLAEKDQIIQEQARKIRELENKPPVVVVETKTQTIEKIKEVEKEKIVEKPITTGESLAEIIAINLTTLEKDLNIELASELKEQISQVGNYQQLSQLRNQAIKSLQVELRKDPVYDLFSAEKSEELSNIVRNIFQSRNTSFFTWKRKEEEEAEKVSESKKCLGFISQEAGKNALLITGGLLGLFLIWWVIKKRLDH
ncbi:protein of unknown function [endosymbiont DhMRE of Dentiscutata heterogama]|uniref:hypothetical protein n=1 Tax=endosymbiont DhMRE of Dentiscutata heterogama TaxID=1609546 RepID=UPI0006329EEC|nr:hypothetical protein [endosymbiont DhMRE of Dentiscutata heterogama]CFW92739.1 protein of unknown function [endosymbiont DhMRE of Dentiscutata heterogama]